MQKQCHLDRPHRLNVIGQWSFAPATSGFVGVFIPELHNAEANVSGPVFGREPTPTLKRATGGIGVPSTLRFRNEHPAAHFRNLLRTRRHSFLTAQRTILTRSIDCSSSIPNVVSRSGWIKNLVSRDCKVPSAMGAYNGRPILGVVAISTPAG